MEQPHRRQLFNPQALAEETCISQLAREIVTRIFWHNASISIGYKEAIGRHPKAIPHSSVRTIHTHALFHQVLCDNAEEVRELDTNMQVFERDIRTYLKQYGRGDVLRMQPRAMAELSEEVASHCDPDSIGADEIYAIIKDLFNQHKQCARTP